MSDIRTGRAADPPTTADDKTAASDRRAFNFKSAPDESVAGLVHRLAEQGSHLAEQQLKLIEAEVRAGVAEVKEFAGAMAGAAVLGLAGLGVLLMGFAYLLAEAMPLWVATLLVAVVALAGAWAMFSAARRKLQSSSLSAKRSSEMLKRAPSAISGHSEEDRRHGR